VCSERACGEKEGVGCRVIGNDVLGCRAWGGALRGSKGKERLADRGRPAKRSEWGRSTGRKMGTVEERKKITGNQQTGLT